jgi:glucose-1-phosphate cytidylyltransferase
MKTVILAGGLGSRLAELTDAVPKPMVPVGGRPIIWHIMSIYASHGYDDFVIACGYKGEVIKKYFHDFHIVNTDFVIHLGDGRIETLATTSPKWTVAPIDTGLHSMTGGRILRLARFLEGGTFMVTYGDALTDLRIPDLLAFHRSHGRCATVTAVRPPARFGGLDLDGDKVACFTEKSQASGGWINGGYFVFEPKIFDYLTGDTCVLERDPLENLARDGELMAYRHDGFWQPMDTLRERRILEDLWASGSPPWSAPR